MSNEELERRYEVYKENFSRKQNDRFFNKNKDAEWYASFRIKTSRFKEKYHPDLSSSQLEFTYKRRQEFLQKYMNDLDEGKYDQIHFDMPDSAEKEKIDDATTAAPASDEITEKEKTEEASEDKDEMDASPSKSEEELKSEQDGEVEEEKVAGDGEVTDERTQDLESFSKSNSLFIKSIPDHVSRSVIFDVHFLSTYSC
jgi:hypothetical protein